MNFLSFRQFFTVVFGNIIDVSLIITWILTQINIKNYYSFSKILFSKIVIALIK